MGFTVFVMTLKSVQFSVLTPKCQAGNLISINKGFPYPHLENSTVNPGLALWLQHFIHKPVVTVQAVLVSKPILNHYLSSKYSKT